MFAISLLDIPAEVHLSEAEASHASLIPAEVVSKLVTQGPLDLAGKQIPVVAKVTLQRVAIDDDPVLIAFARDAIPEVLAVGVLLGSEIGDYDRNVRQHLLELVG